MIRYDTTTTWCEYCDKRIYRNDVNTYKYSLISPTTRLIDNVCLCKDCAEKVYSYFKRSINGKC